jgi:hypothetical protein
MSLMKVYGVMDCGCRVVIDPKCPSQSSIEYCTRHSASTELFDALANLASVVFVTQPKTDSQRGHTMLQEALNRANRATARKTVTI